MRKLAPLRYELKGALGADNYKYGDLYGFSYLPLFKVNYTIIPPPVQLEKNKNINFYCICDSYIFGYPIGDSLLYGVNRYIQSRWFFDEVINEEIDTTKTNFLMIEMAERNTRFFLSDSSDIYSKLIPANYPVNNNSVSYKKDLKQNVEKVFSNTFINKNLEFNIFDYSFLTPLKEFKASMNYELFNRYNTDVVMSGNKRFLFYKPTVDTTTKESSFKYLSEKECSDMTSHLNSIYEYYHRRGFKYIYFSIIPNPVSLIEPSYSKYNELITKIQNDPNLKVPFLDAQSILSNDPEKFYKKSDTHWNSYGFNMWLNKLNEILKKISENK